MHHGAFILKIDLKKQKDSISLVMKSDIFNIRFKLSSLVLYMLCVHGNRVECNVNESGARDTPQIPSEHYFHFHFLISQWLKHEDANMRNLLEKINQSSWRSEITVRGKHSHCPQTHFPGLFELVDLISCCKLYLYYLNRIF